MHLQEMHVTKVKTNVLVPMKGTIYFATLFWSVPDYHKSTGIILLKLVLYTPWRRTNNWNYFSTHS